MDQCLIDSDSHHAKDSYQSGEREIISGQRKDDDGSSDRKEDTGNDDDSIFDIIELQNQYEDHQEQSYDHCISHILHALWLRFYISSARILQSLRQRMIFDNLIDRCSDIAQRDSILFISLDRDIPFSVIPGDSIDFRF